MPAKRNTGDSSYYQWPWSINQNDSVYVFTMNKHNKAVNYKLGTLLAAGYRSKLLKSREGKHMPCLLVTTTVINDSQDMDASQVANTQPDEETFALCLEEFIPRHASTKWQTNDMLVRLYDKEYEHNKRREGAFIKTYIATEISQTQDVSLDFQGNAQEEKAEGGVQQPAAFTVTGSNDDTPANRLLAPSQAAGQLPLPRTYYTFALVTSCIFEIWLCYCQYYRTCSVCCVNQS